MGYRYQTLQDGTVILVSDVNGSAAILANAPVGIPVTSPGPNTTTIPGGTGTSRFTVIGTFYGGSVSPIVDFTYVVKANRMVQFINKSLNATTYLWSFGDGRTSTLKDPVHEFPAIGTYSVVLFANSGTQSVAKVLSVVVTQIAESVNFSYISSGTTLYCFDTSTVINTERLWTFGTEGTATRQNPSHVFSEAGTYTVTLLTNRGTRSHDIVISEGGSFEVVATNDSPGIYDPIWLGVGVDDTYVYAGTRSATAPMHRYLKSDLSYVDSWGSQGEGQNNEYGIAVDGDYIYRVDVYGALNGATIRKYDKTTKALADSFSSYGSQVEGKIDQAYGIAIDDTYVYVIDNGWAYQSKRIQVFNKSTKAWVAAFHPTSAGDWGYPRDIKIHGGKAFVLHENGYLYVYAVGTWALETTITASGSGDGQWTDGDGLAVNDSSIFISDGSPFDSAHRRIVVLSNNQSLGYPFAANIATGNTYKSNCSLALDYTHLFLTTQSETSLRKFSLGGQDPAMPEAYFTVSITPSALPVTADFTDGSANGPTSWLWEFGDGNTSTEQSPTHAYAEAGIYEVALTAGNYSGSSTYSAKILIEAVDYEMTVVPPLAAITASALIITPGGSIDFTDSSLGTPVSWVWSFGDGTISTDQNPTHTFELAGQYVVTLIATDTDGKTSTASITVIVSADTDPDHHPPLGSITLSSQTIYGLIDVDFSSTLSTVPTAYIWYFGDGYASSSATPRHRYKEAGTYTVTLTVTNAYGTSTMSIQLVVVDISARALAYAQNYVVFRGTHRVRIYNATGAFTKEFGGYGSGPGQFRNPISCSPVVPKLR
jgi:PKD repeat protein